MEGKQVYQMSLFDKYHTQNAKFLENLDDAFGDLFTNFHEILVKKWAFIAFKWSHTNLDRS